MNTGLVDKNGNSIYIGDKTRLVLEDEKLGNLMYVLRL